MIIIYNTFLGVSGKARGAHARLLGNEENGRLHQINWSNMHVGGKSGGKIYVHMYTCSFINCYLTCDILSFVWIYRKGILLLFNHENQIYLQSSHFVPGITITSSGR